MQIRSCGLQRNSILSISILFLLLISSCLHSTARGAGFFFKQLPASNSFTEIIGLVIDEQRSPIEGATITIQRSGKATSTNREGNFTISGVMPGDILIVTSIGYQQEEVKVNSSGNLLIGLKLAIGTLDETIVIAYGTTSKRYSTGTVSKVSEQEIKKQPISNPLAALSGRVAGLQVSQGSGMPGSFFKVQLRGQNSIANGNEPLFIIDGIPYPSTTLNGTFGGGGGAVNSPLNAINPTDIESIEVLKDADATAIYGSRGANGVILISTKKGHRGKTIINVNAYTGWGKIKQRLDLMNTQQYLSMRHEAFLNDGTNPTVSNARDLLVWDTTRYTDWQKLLIGNTMSTSDIKATISGGSEQTQFLIGTGYHKETTVMPGSFGEEKVSFNFNINHRSDNKKFQIAVDGSYLQNDNLLPQNDITPSITLSPNAPELYDSTGDLNWEKSTWTNPLSLLRKKFHTKTENLIANLLLTYKIFPGLELKATVGFNRLTQDEHVTIPINSYDPSWVVTGTAGFGNNQIRTIITEPQINYRKILGNNNLAVLAGYTLHSTDRQALYTTGSGYVSDQLLGSLKAASTINASTEVDSRYRYVGFFARVNYDYNRKYFVTLTGRRDGSSRYGPTNRFSNFGSLGVAWIFSNEKFFSSTGIFSFGKIKASAGITGNDQIGDYKYLDMYSPYTYSYLGLTPFQPTQLYNPDYGWEKVKKIEAGLELGFIHDRLFLSANYYRNTSSSQLVSYALPQMTGFSGVLRNLPATILNEGVEIELSSKIVQGKDLKWSGSFNLTFPRNRLLSFDGIESSTYSNTYIVGQSLFIDKNFIYTGIDKTTGNYTFNDVNGDGKITSPADQTAIVFTGQQFFGGLSNSLQYKNMGFSFLIQFIRHKNVPNFLTRFTRPGTMNNQPEFLIDRWQSPGDNATYQKYSNSNSLSNAGFSNYRSSDAAFSDASFIRLRNVELNYQLPFAMMNRIGIEQCTIFAQGHNLFTLTDYKGLDPETKSVLPPVTIGTIGIRFTL